MTTLATDIINIESLQVKSTDDITQDKCIMKMDGHEILTAGNFSAIIGKAKSMKTFLATMFCAAASGRRELYDKFSPNVAGNVVYIDTEQSPYHLLRVVKRIVYLAGNEDNLCAYGLRPYSPMERVDLIERILSESEKIEFMILDGVRDLVTNINSEEQATDTVTRLMKWTQEFGVHIMTIIHQNKADSNARGHIGTEIMNKSEAVMSVTKDINISRVVPEYFRGRGFNEFSFTIDTRGIPVVDGYEESGDNSLPF